MTTEFNDFISRDRALRCFQELRRGRKHVRMLIKTVGGTPATVLKRISELIALGFAKESREGNRRIIELTETGSDCAQRLEYMIHPGSPNEREKWILALLWAMGDDRISKCIVGRIRLQKLLFLLKHDRGLPVPYRFYSFKYGPFDDDITNDARNLEAKMLIRIKLAETRTPTSEYEAELYELTPEGADIARKAHASFSKDVRTRMRELRSFNRGRLATLIDYVYSNFPEYKSKASPEFVQRMGLAHQRSLMKD